MKLEYTLSKNWSRCKTGIFKLGISIGLTIMMASNVNGAPVFKLKAPQDYFADTRTLSLLNAALAGNLAKAQQLVAEGANPNDDGPKDNLYNRLRLLHYAIAANNAQAIQVLMAVGADPELKTDGFGRAFLFAMTLDNVEMLSLLLDLKPVDKLSRETLKSILFESVAMPRPRCLKVLLKRGAPIDFPDDAGYTILMRSLNAMDFDLTEWLLQQGASVNVESGGGVTPAYSVQDKLERVQPGSESHRKLLRLKALMEARGAVFPAMSPKENRARRAATGK